MKAHKAEERKRYNELVKKMPEYAEDNKFGQHEAWCVEEMEVLD